MVALICAAAWRLRYPLMMMLVWFVVPTALWVLIILIIEGVRCFL